MMEKRPWKVYAFWIFLAEAVGALAGILTRGGIEVYNQSIIKPELSPPAVVFPIVWVVLYALMGIGVARVSMTPESTSRIQGIWLFLAQLFFNFLWSIIFFNFQAWGLAWIWILLLWAMVVWMTLTFWETDRVAAVLQIPYLLWVTFAGYLNLMVLLLNR